MGISNTLSTEPLFNPFQSAYRFISTKLIAKTPEVEVYYVPALGNQTDPEFLMVTKDSILIRFAYTGDMIGVYKSNSNASKTLDTILEMDPQHRWHINRSNLPIEGVVGSAAPEQVLEDMVNYAYAKAQSVNGSNRDEMAHHFRVLTYEAILARFHMLRRMLSDTDIIPDQSPRTIIVKAGNGCKAKCYYCPEGIIPFVSFTRDQFIAHLQQTKHALSGILGEDGITRMNEGFINISDIGWLDIDARNGKTDLTSVGAAELMRQYFPWLEKIGTFIGSATALVLSKDKRGTYEFEGQRYSPNFLKGLRGGREARLVNRLYLGLETAHTEGSKLLNKNITYEQKLMAARLIRAAEIPLKVIVQLGVLGVGFHYQGRDGKQYFVPWQEAIDQTARWINEVRPYRLLESEYQPSIASPLMQRLIDEGRIVIPENVEGHIRQERQRLREKVRVQLNSFRIDPEYEQFLPPSKKDSYRLIPTA